MNRLHMCVYSYRAMICIWPGILYAQVSPGERNYVFDQLTRDDGLSNGYVTSIKQDSIGFLWFATAEGLNRFDGYSFEVLRAGQGPNQLSHPNIWDIEITKSGDIWIATSSGLNHYNPRKRTNKQYFHEPENDSSLSHSRIRFVYEDRFGDLWISTNNGINRKRRSEDTFDRFIFGQEDDVLTATQIVEDEGGTLWVTSGAAIYRFSREMGQFEQFELPRESLLVTDVSEEFARVLIPGPDSTLYVGTLRSGLFQFSLRSLEFTSHWTRSDENGLATNRINALLIDDTGTLWIGTDGGLNFMDEAQYITEFEVDGPLSEHHNIKDIWVLFQDRDGNIWMGTNYGGVKVVYRHKKPITTYLWGEGTLTSLGIPANSSYGVSESPSVWYLTDERGLKQVDLENGQVHSFYLPAPVQHIAFVLNDPDGKTWIGTPSSGLFVLYNSSTSAYPIKPKRVLFESIYRFIFKAAFPCKLVKNYI